jgi:murein DD-endopeptidase MepM/ murein hydrolase activator NlpD
MTPFQLAARDPNDPILSPTPDSLRALPTIRSQVINYTVQINDTVGDIAYSHGVTIEEILQANALPNPDVLSVGQVLAVPAPVFDTPGPAFKIIPDSELVDGPANAVFNLQELVSGYPGYLASYNEGVKGQVLSGWQIVERVATLYSVNPRLLLALLEHQSEWLTNPDPRVNTLSYPMGYADGIRLGLYQQLSWAANNLNMGYYLWKINGVGLWRTTDGVIIPIEASINAGTAGVQHLLSLLYDEASWRIMAGEHGFYKTYNLLFGYPFDWGIEPLIPSDLTQPAFQLPFEPGVPWVFTGGAHGGWDVGSAWAAIDFAPSSEQQGCAQKDEWVVAVADGLIVRAENGGVSQDLDGDGAEQTGWTVFYMHIETRDRVQAGQFVKAGERIGHPSCEGGFSTGSHLHIARKYNGEWISADRPVPFVMDGWVMVGDGINYSGALVRGETRVIPCECREPENMVQR